MGVETPLALLGMLGVLIPLLVHRMRNRELPHLVLPTFALLSRAVAKTRSDRALTDLLLLLLRAAIVVVAALAVATPYLRSRLRYGDGRLANLVVVIDDSLSMSRKDAGSMLIDKARARAIEAIGSLPDGSEVAVILAGKPARVLAPLTRDRGAIVNQLADAALHAVRGNDLAEALELALREQHRGLIPTHRLLVLSDFARHAAFDPKDLALDGTALNFERVGAPPNKPNLFITHVHASVDPARPAETSIAVELRSTSPDGLSAQPAPARVEIELNGKVASTSAAFEHGTAKTTLQLPTPSRNEASIAQVHVVADDALDTDNRAFLVLGDADALQLLLVNGDPRPANRGDELYYVTRALSLMPGTELALNVQTADALSFEHAALDAQDVIVLANMPAPSSAIAKRLIEFVETGGGLIVTGGSHVEASAYNARLGPVLPSHLRGTADAANVRLSLGPQGTVLRSGLAGLHEVRSRERLLLENKPLLETLLSYDDGAPALVARNVGEGRCLLLATTLDIDFSDLPLRPGFLPLLATMLREAAGATSAGRGHIAPGEGLALPSPRRGHYVEVRSPDGHSQRFTVDKSTETPRFSADMLGVFEIRTGTVSSMRDSTLKAMFVVDPPPDESDLTPGPVPQLDEGTAKAPPPLHAHVPMTPWIWLVAFALIACEGAMRVRRRWA